MIDITIRDTFAAAALTGLLANEGDSPSLSSQCCYAYHIADAMLRERERGTDDTPVTEPIPKEKQTEVYVRIDGVDLPASYSKSDEKRVNWHTNRDTARPLYRHPQPTLTDAEREAISYAAGLLDSLPWYQKKLREALERLR